MISNYSHSLAKKAMAPLFAAAFLITMPYVANACGEESGPARLTPTNTYLSTSNATTSCTFGSSSCLTGETINFAVIAFGADLSCFPHTFEWEFGDGTTASTVVPQTTHVFPTASVYVARVVVTGTDTIQLDGTAHLILTRTQTIGAAIPALSTVAAVMLFLALGAVGAFFAAD